MFGVSVLAHLSAPGTPPAPAPRSCPRTRTRSCAGWTCPRARTGPRRRARSRSRTPRAPPAPPPATPPSRPAPAPHLHHGSELVITATLTFLFIGKSHGKHSRGQELQVEKYIIMIIFYLEMWLDHHVDPLLDDLQHSVQSASLHHSWWHLHKWVNCSAPEYSPADYLVICRYVRVQQVSMSLLPHNSIAIIWQGSRERLDRMYPCISLIWSCSLHRASSWWHSLTETMNNWDRTEGLLVAGLGAWIICCSCSARRSGFIGMQIPNI